jgi:hypothetical protein
MLAIERETTAGNIIRSTAVALPTPTRLRRTSMGEQRAGIPRRTARQMHVRTKVSEARGSRLGTWIAVVDSNLAPATVEREVQAAQTEEVAAEIAWATEAYHQAPAVAPRVEAALLAGLRVEEGEEARERAVREVPPAWEAREEVEDGGGNQP